MERIKILREYLESMDSREKVYNLFREQLGFPSELMQSSRVSEKALIAELKRELKEKVVGIFKILNFNDKLPIFLVEVNSDVKNKFISDIARYFSDNFNHPLFIITSNYKQYAWVLPGKKIGNNRKITKLSIDIGNLYRTDLETILKLRYQDSWSPREAIKAFEQAFKVKRVTEQFFEEFKNNLIELRDLIRKQNISLKDAHALALQTMSRIMFLYFVSKKRWLNNNPNFPGWYFKQYKKERNNGNRDTFYEVYLKQLFFKAFNNIGGFQGISSELKGILESAPYLNGGLYKENRLDKLNVKLTDDIFDKIFAFFDSYNFTIKEDVFVREVAVDPEMIGHVYESLANVAEEIYTNHDLGIFYTPREEVDFMCRNALVEYLNNKVDIDKSVLYDLVFSSDKTIAESTITKSNLWRSIRDVVDDILVVDPACGSGAFLVGMLLVLSEIMHIANTHLNIEKKDYEIKERIIERNLYGVDVMPWAIQCAELRLWLQLVVESDLSKNRLKLSPILPNLDLNLRVGDSVVQQSGGIDIEFDFKSAMLSKNIKNKIYKLKEEKHKYFNSDKTGIFTNKKHFILEEIRIFTDFINENIKKLNDQLVTIGSPTIRHLGFAGSSRETENKDAMKKIEDIKNKIEKLRTLKRIIQDPQKKPFVWEMDFAEVFADKGGFDIVIGNPPYLRQEDIAPPNSIKGTVTREEKDRYKKMLKESIKSRYPKNKAISRILDLSGRSDLYIYFYFVGLSLLNPNGIFSFITSNSWLDVDYGKNLQEFLVKYVPIIGIYDNEKKRSFEHADVNTVIVLFRAPRINKNPTEYAAENNIAKFVMFKKPFEDVITADNLKRIDNMTLMKNENFKKYPEEGLFEQDADFRALALRQSYLYKEGLDKTDGKEIYIGDKWGGKYLRAPDIYFTILEKGKGKLVKLGDIAEIRRGFTTGANDFFYVEDVTDEIED